MLDYIPEWHDAAWTEGSPAYPDTFYAGLTL